MGQAKLDHGIGSGSLIVISHICKRFVKLLDAGENPRIGDVFRSVVMNDVHNNRQGHQHHAFARYWLCFGGEKIINLLFRFAVFFQPIRILLGTFQY